ncbi:hypothetical protein RvY_06385 [Ramazzottius varieornatus]|uniref:Large ribosomal subunit protein bL9m n=1 Tax=Ramazzottius varieornatus TaxID=947166 RepID=A0A1D1V744_RAMVA|nr:hypothetical protein RvY_06385 [Ramazzottius varieornatus]
MSQKMLARKVLPELLECCGWSVRWNYRRRLSQTATRSTWVLKREHQMPLSNLTGRSHKAIREYEKVYLEVSGGEEQKPPPIDVLLLKDVPGHGRAGDVVSVKRNIARMFLLPEGKATYVTAEGLTAFATKKEFERAHPELQSSSSTAPTAVIFLENMCLDMPMNMHNPWTIERWQVRNALRKQGVWCPGDHVLELPAQAISGPNPDQHGKCFSIFLTINNKERACVLCRINLQCKDPAEALPPLPTDEGKPINPVPLFPGAVFPENKAPTRFPKKKTLNDVPYVPPYRMKDF